MPLRKSRARRNRKSPLLRRFRLLRSARRKISSVPSSPPASAAEAGPLDHALSKSATSKTVEMMPRTIARSGGRKGRRSFILMSYLVVEGRAQPLRNDLRRGTGRKQEVASVEGIRMSGIGKAEERQLPGVNAGVGRGGGTDRPCAEQERDKQDGRDDAAYDRKKWRHEGSAQLHLDVIPGRRGPRAAPPQ